MLLPNKPQHDGSIPASTGTEITVFFFQNAGFEVT
jgi:hypothetical protein